ncbi:hypothetical protein LAZ67_1001961 [Cordylochernes scorpioides]|uniref:MSP domain-containing protein n=1 Tax=Cordylochernes scorpioides TaxID=51811 RepID=A0ABY6JX74_9ARAC|nr:hypothetical protein LAZ67_1001961 [Cordylochernes scorpioides]
MDTSEDYSSREFASKFQSRNTIWKGIPQKSTISKTKKWTIRKRGIALLGDLVLRRPRRCERRRACRTPSTSTTDEKINEVEKMILANRRITVREVAEDLNISIGSCHSIFINDLGMRRVAAKFVPKLLNCDQKQHRMNIANEMLDSVRDDPNLLQRVITGDEAPAIEVEFPTLSPNDEKPSEIAISLNNITEDRVAYKVKTNNIDCYRVRPPTGIIPPSSKVDITIQLLPGMCNAILHLGKLTILCTSGGECGVRTSPAGQATVHAGPPDSRTSIGRPSPTGLQLLRTYALVVGLAETLAAPPTLFYLLTVDQSDLCYF